MLLHIVHLGKQAQRDRPGLYSLGRGQGGAQDCGLRAKLTPTSKSPSPSTPPPSHTLAPLAGARAELRGSGLGPRLGCCRGLE